MRQDDRDIFSGTPVQREALAWVARLNSGEADQDDATALSAWRERSPAHEEAFRQAARLWNRLGPALEEAPSRQSASVSGMNRRTFLRAGALAAGVAGIGMMGNRAGIWPSLTQALADHRTGTGERRRIDLADGSVVELNTRSSLSVRFTEAERRLDLHSGEAVFTVRRDPNRPFVVAAASGTTTALGTVFSVHAKQEQVAVACLEGAVDVTCNRAARLKAGERVAYDESGIGPTFTHDGVTVGAWRKGVLVFRDDAIDRVVDEINRYRPGRVIVVDQAKGARRISGIFHLDRLDEALAHLQDTYQLRPIALPGGLLVLG